MKLNNNEERRPTRNYQLAKAIVFKSVHVETEETVSFSFARLLML